MEISMFEIFNFSLGEIALEIKFDLSVVLI